LRKKCKKKDQKNWLSKVTQHKNHLRPSRWKEGETADAGHEKSGSTRHALACSKILGNGWCEGT